MEFLQKKTPKNEPRTLLVIGKPKVGKTTVCSFLPNSIFLDYEDGTEFVKHDSVFNVKEAKGEHWRQLKEIGKQFDFAIIDSCTSMENWISENIVSNHNKNVPDKEKVSSITEMAYGQGYGLLRTKTIGHLEVLLSMFKKVIFIGHSKDKQVDSNSIVLDLDLTGKNSPIFMSRIDVIGFLHRHKKELALHFSAAEAVIGGSRIDRLDGKKIILSEKTDKGIVTYWDEIYPETLKTKIEGDKK